MPENNESFSIEVVQVTGPVGAETYSSLKTFQVGIRDDDGFTATINRQLLAADDNDDNDDGVTDGSHDPTFATMIGDEYAELTLDFDFDPTAAGMVGYSLAVTKSSNAVTLWYDDGGTLTQVNGTFAFGPGSNVPTTFYVRGKQGGPATITATVSGANEDLSNTYNQSHAFDVFVYQADLDIFSSGYSTLNAEQAGSDEISELTIGAFGAVNDDDTDGDEEVDSEDDDDVRPAGDREYGRLERDLLKLVIRKPALPSASPGDLNDKSDWLKLSITQGSAKLWAQPWKGTPLEVNDENPLEINPWTIPDEGLSLWAELPFPSLSTPFFLLQMDPHRESAKANSHAKITELMYLTKDQSTGTTADLRHDNPEASGGGYRVFPDGAIPSITENVPSLTGPNNIVRIKITLDKALQANESIWFRVYDVDDPSADDTIDPNKNRGGDNRGVFLEFPLTSFVTHKTGQIRSSSAQNATGWVDGENLLQLQSDSTTLYVDLAISLSPGDNYRVAAVIATTKADAEKELGTKPDDTMPTSESNPRVVSSENLSVWRRLIVEHDNMAQVTAPSEDDFDHKSGAMSAASASISGYPHLQVVKTNIATRATGQYQGGLLFANNQYYRIMTNTKSDTGAEFGVFSEQLIPAGNIHVYEDDFTQDAASTNPNVFGVSIIYPQTIQGTTSIYVNRAITYDVDYILFSNTKVVKVTGRTVLQDGSTKFTLLDSVTENDVKAGSEIQIFRRAGTGQPIIAANALLNSHAYFALMQDSPASQHNLLASAYI